MLLSLQRLEESVTATNDIEHLSTAPNLSCILTVSLLYSNSTLSLLILYSYSSPTLLLLNCYCLSVVSRSQGLAGGDAIDSDDEDDGVAGETITLPNKILCSMNCPCTTFRSSLVVHCNTVKMRISIRIIGLLCYVQAPSKR